MRLLILGAGRLGTGLCHQLRAQRAGGRLAGEVLATTTTPARHGELAAAGARPSTWEVGDRGTLARLLEGVDTIVLSLAAGREADYAAVYGGAAADLAATLGGHRARRLVYTSSVGVYGEDRGQWVDEDTPARPADDRSRALLEAERSLLATGEEHGLRTTVLRLAGLHNDDRGPARFAPRLSGRAADGARRWLNLLHEDDAVTALLRLLDHDHHGVLCLSDGEPVFRQRFYDAVLSGEGLPAPRWTDADAPPSGKRVRSGLAHRSLGLHPRRVARELGALP